ncbi:polymorphic toxin-type HINT domain-containing protein, partial [Frigidibacter sp. SD6-1]|uniref:polymorphic toxin-type HINT domain-containing protein n=1 Tax=Frigidibacter sp. SD6-1 TaxID=3032581 RepID=UPI0024DF9454
MSVLTGKVRIEDLREGDLVIARNEETGEVGPYPVAAIMGRQATDLVWLGLEASGQSSRLGVTAEHPLYVEGRGWVQAGELAPGDRIVDADGGVITVVSAELDDRPTLVHNLEVA